MTEEQMRIRLAELVGWKAVKYDFGLACKIRTNPHDGWVGIPPVIQKMEHGQDESREYNYWPVPQFHNDLNCVAEIERGLTDEQHERFRFYLRKAIGCNFGGCINIKHQRDYVTATARQRTEALIRTLEGKE